ncbi:unnamed protein product [Fusarium graminearum]|uniref:Chromosome 2, complete genome n=2 Tax=Gibberella zeae TaxID=5518 RepID=A0A0E0S038_GIBZE|nr:hypothetical protein FG05_35265 [Fusarium graminearum]CEF76863.1 unnamed protein product [Fusarium graminearum]
MVSEYEEEIQKRGSSKLLMQVVLRMPDQLFIGFAVNVSDTLSPFEDLDLEGEHLDDECLYLGRSIRLMMQSIVRDAKFTINMGDIYDYKLMPTKSV